MDLRDGHVTLRWPNRKAGPFAVQIRMEHLRGRFEVVELALGSVKDDQPITGSLLRELRVAELASEVAQLLTRLDVSQRLEPGEPLNAAEMEMADPDWRKRRELAFAPMWAAAAREREALAAVPATQRRHIDEEIAQIYLEAFGQHRPPTKAVAEALGISRAAAAKRVGRARQAGLLPATDQGRAAGIGSRRRTKHKGARP